MAPAPVTHDPFGPALRRAREQRGATQADVARQLGVTRATIAQWETGRHLPAADKIRRLEDLLADATLGRLAERGRDAGRPPEPTEPQRSTLNLFRRVAAALDGYLQRDPDGRPLGWCQDLQYRRDATPVSTAYGLKALVVTAHVAPATLVALHDRLQEARLRDGGWGTNKQVSRPESTAVVLDALALVDRTILLDEPLATLERLLADDEIAGQRPGVLASVLDVVLELRPDSPFTADLLQRLLDSRQANGGRGPLWIEKTDPDLASPEPSVPHTARAVRVLARARSLGAADKLSGEVDEAIGTAVDWLVRQDDLQMLVEKLERSIPGSPVDEVVYLRHFTGAWIAQALLTADVAATHPAVRRALSDVRGAFSDAHALYRFRNGDLPIWMTYDGVATEQLAALASASVS